MAFSLEDFKERVLGFEKNFVRFVIDPLHGQIGLTELEDEVVRTKAFMRLKKIQQLGFVSNIYPAATHKRYEHCIGTLHVTWTMLKRLIKNYASPPCSWCNEEVLNFFSDEILKSLRLAALLHDVGHGPFSHSFEQAARDLGQKVDHEKITNYLLTYRFPQERINNLFPDRETLNALRKSRRMGQFRKELRVIPRTTREAIVGIYNKDYEMKMFKPPGFNRIRLFLNAVLKGDIGSDRIDYLLRDTYFSGLGHRFNFSDLLENLRGMYDEKLGRLLLAIDSNGRNILEFLMMTRYYHYRLIAHHPRNVLEETIFRERIKHLKESKKASYFYEVSMSDDTLEGQLPAFETPLDIVGTWDMGTIGVDHYRFLFYRVASDPHLRASYIRKIKENIVQGVSRRKKKNIDENDIFLAFVVEKPHIPILQNYRPRYLIKKDVLEKYSVLHHDHSILIRGLARTYLEDTSLLVFTSKDCHKSVSEFTHSTHHFYLDPSLFRDLISNVNTFKSSRYDFLLYALYTCMQSGLERFDEGITKLFDEIRKLHEKHKLHFYDFDTKDFYDPDFGSFCYPKVSGKEDTLIDDLFLFDATGLIEIKVHHAKRLYKGKDFYSNSYFFVPTKRYREIGLPKPIIPLKSTLRMYPDTFISNYGLKDVYMDSF
jgi:HD superfamily phosphohydrolase